MIGLKIAATGLLGLATMAWLSHANDKAGKKDKNWIGVVAFFSFWSMPVGVFIWIWEIL